MSISKGHFGTLSDGTQVTAWKLTNEKGLTAEILDYGVTIRAILVPDQTGALVDVVLGYDTLEEYVEDDCYVGATVGRFANRIKGASFCLGGKTYALYANNGENHLHGGKKGFDRYLWHCCEEGESLIFSRLSPDGEEGYPGNLRVQVKIYWKGNSLRLEYEAETDKETVLNLTNHSYFNLNGEGNIHGHVLQINAESFTENAADNTPTGAVLPVAGTAMDFRAPKPIGRDVDREEPCVRLARGYDGNFVLSGHPAAVAVGEKSGITMTVDTDQPGLQLYTANFLNERRDKGGRTHGFRSAFCLETQHFPDSVHHPEWPSCILRPGEIFQSFTSFTFA